MTLGSGGIGLSVGLGEQRRLPVQAPSEITRNVAVPPAKHLAKPARSTPCTAAIQAYASLLQDHESARTLGKPLLTEAGLVYVRHRLLPAALSALDPGRSTNGTPLPYWDAENRRLWLGTYLVKEFRQPAPNQTTLLDVFQEQGWAGRIDDPLGLADGEGEKDAKRRLHETIKNLNRGLAAGTIRFRGDGTGEGVVWEYGGCEVVDSCWTKGRRARRRRVLPGGTGTNALCFRKSRGLPQSEPLQRL
jgi:hypothetical protein